MELKQGQRVYYIRDSSIGYVQSIQNKFVEIKWVTPNNQLMNLTSVCFDEDLIAIPEHVIPMPRPKNWINKTWTLQNKIIFLLDDEGII